MHKQPCGDSKALWFQIFLLVQRRMAGYLAGVMIIHKFITIIFINIALKCYIWGKRILNGLWRTAESDPKKMEERNSLLSLWAKCGGWSQCRFLRLKQMTHHWPAQLHWRRKSPQPQIKSCRSLVHISKASLYDLPGAFKFLGFCNPGFLHILRWANPRGPLFWRKFWARLFYLIF